MNKPTFFQNLYLPFFSADYYRFVVKNKTGFGLKTLFAVLTLNWLVTLLIISIGFFRIVSDPEFKTMKDDILQQIPEITIKDGKVSIQEPTPYIITLPDSSPIAAIIGENDEVSATVAKSLILVTPDEVVVNNNDRRQSRSYKTSDWEDATFNSEAIEAFGQMIIWFTIPILLVFAVGGSYLFRLLQVFVFAGIGQIFNAIFGTSLVFDQMCRLTSAALTPVLLFDIGLFYVWGGPKLWFFNFFLAMIFLGFGVASCKEGAGGASVQA